MRLVYNYQLCFFSLDLYTGIISAILRESGTFPSTIDLFINMLIGKYISSFICLIKCIDRLSYPVLCFGLRALIMLDTSLGSRYKLFPCENGEFCVFSLGVVHHFHHLHERTESTLFSTTLPPESVQAMREKMMII